MHTKLKSWPQALPSLDQPQSKHLINLNLTQLSFIFLSREPPLLLLHFAAMLWRPKSWKSNIAYLSEKWKHMPRAVKSVIHQSLKRNEPQLWPVSEIYYWKASERRHQMAPTLTMTLIFWPRKKSFLAKFQNGIDNHLAFSRVICSVSIKRFDADEKESIFSPKLKNPVNLSIHFYDSSKSRISSTPSRFACDRVLSREKYSDTGLRECGSSHSTETH